MTDHAVVTPAAWREARLELLAKEKEFTRLRDELSVARALAPINGTTVAEQHRPALGAHPEACACRAWRPNYRVAA